MTGLRLEAREYTGLTRWRWVLTDSSGAFLADHEVRLDAASWQYEAFGDLRGYLRWHCAPDRRAQDEARIVAEAGAWIGSAVVGPAIRAALVRRRPATVRVVVPPEAAELLYRPLELAHANGKPLAVQDVTLVMDAGDGAGLARIEPVGERLRLLGLFSLPEGGRTLNLRRERSELVRLVRALDATGKAADVRVLQYGVTRERLRDVLEESEGWDIIHICGHGRPGSLTLETASGQPDRVSADELAGLLGPARARLKLVTLSACWSAAMLADEQRRLLGLPALDRHDDSAERDDGGSSPATPSGTLAGELTGQLGCAVLAMRYPVGDDFAIALSEKLYDLLARQGQPLPRAVGMTLRELSAGSRYAPLSAGTPALFGGVAADLRLAAPDRHGPLSYDTALLTMARFPPEPARFVGRTGVLARASAALAPASGIPGVLLHGMPGGGKTACALELAYGHQEAFDRLAWYKAPDEGMAIDGALTDFALTLERCLTGFQMADSLVPAERLAAFAPRLTELMEQRRLLIVIDNLESLLSEGGSWRDDRWGLVMTALTGHGGRGRVIVTSRRRLAGGWPGVRAEAVDLLSADEALLLARELPNLNALTLGVAAGLGANVSRQLARNAIALAHGHPKLLELAEGQAANPDHLRQLVRTGDQEWRRLGGVPGGFFADEQSAATGEDYLQVLAAWTKAVTGPLTPGERDLFWVLCCLEEPDRERPVLDAAWPAVWDRLGRAGQPPDATRALAVIVASGLAALRGEATSYAVHPGVAAAGRAQAGQAFRDAVDAELADYWIAGYRHAAGDSAGAAVHTGLMVRAGLAAAPYLMRQEMWAEACYLLERAFVRDPSRANATAIMPALQQIARHDPAQVGALTGVQRVISPAAAEATARAALDAATARTDYWAAFGATSMLIDIGLADGRLAEALTLADTLSGYARQGGFGPWTRLFSDVRRLQLLNSMGRADEVMTEVRRLRGHLETLPAQDSGEAAPDWNVREILFDTGSQAASRLGQWDDALALNIAQVDSMRQRRAPVTQIARAAFNGYPALHALGRADEARDLLIDCRQVFADARDTEMLGLTIGALAEVEEDAGHIDAAVRLVRDALRYRYLAGDVAGIAAGYHNLGRYAHVHARQPVLALACHLAAALISALTHARLTSDPLRGAASDLRVFGGAAIPPGDVADLCGHLADVSGTDLPGLIARLCPGPEAAERTLRDLIAQAQELGASATELPRSRARSGACRPRRCPSPGAGDAGQLPGSAGGDDGEELGRPVAAGSHAEAAGCASPCSQRYY